MTVLLLFRRWRGGDYQDFIFQIRIVLQPLDQKYFGHFPALKATRKLKATVNISQ